MLHYPNFDPILLHLWGPFSIRWYSLLYVGGFVVGGLIARHLAKSDRFEVRSDQVESLTSVALLSAVIGARIIYCFVYDPDNFFADPLSIFKVYQGGLSFHGGLLGGFVGAYLFCRAHKLNYLNVIDFMALCIAPGLGMGRLGNFINAELYGRVTTVPWGMVFPRGGPLPRHPSQLYEMFLEGFVLFTVLWVAKSRLKANGQIAAAFVILYSLARFFVEFFREPDVQVGYLLFSLSMGQWLCALMFGLGVGWVYFLQKKYQKELLNQGPTGKPRPLRVAGRRR